MEKGKTGVGESLGKKDQKFGCGCVNSERPVRHSSGDSKKQLDV